MIIILYDALSYSQWIIDHFNNIVNLKSRVMMKTNWDYSHEKASSHAKKTLLIFLCLFVGAFASESYAQTPKTKIISGVVSDTKGGTLPGVSVVIKGTTTGTITDINGKYSLSNVQENATVSFSFVGMIKQDVATKGQTKINVKLVDETTGLNEVVVVGYGTMRKSDLTGSNQRVKVSDVASLTNSNLMQALSGSVAGVNIQVASGSPGQEPDLSIRGQTSLSGSDKPLIVMDGIIYNGDVSNINVNDVETVDILKDASSAAVYGSRSANGVILITTKKGKSEKPTVSFGMSYGYQDITNNPMKIMNAEQYAVRMVDYNYQQTLYNWYKSNPTSITDNLGRPVRPDITDRNIVAASLKSQEEKDNYIAGNAIDWMKEVTRTAAIQNYNLSFSGKTEKSNYYVSGAYANEEGILLNDQFKRLTLNSNLETKITNWLTLGLISTYTYRDYSGVPASLNGARGVSPLANNMIGLPNHDLYLTGDTYMGYPLDGLDVDQTDIRNSLFMVGSAKVTVPWVKGLSYELSYANTANTKDVNSFSSASTLGGISSNGTAIKNPTDDRSSIVNNIVTYLKTFGDHHVNATLLYSRENRFGSSTLTTVKGFANPLLGYNNLSLGTTPTAESSAWEENSISYMARANYTYLNRYILTGTIRRDGFSGFGGNNKYADFPSASIGWIATEEPLFKNNGMVYLKLRASYGVNGNQGSGVYGRYASLSKMDNDAYAFGTSTATAVYPSSIGNPNLGWEKTASFNIGIDHAFLNHRISGSIDFYNAKTTNVLVTRKLPTTSGYASIYTNIGGIENNGIELSLKTINVQGEVNWTSNFSFSLNRDKITEIYGDGKDDLGSSWFIGKPISAIYDYTNTGVVWTEQELFNGDIKVLKDGWYPGHFKYVDLNKDGVIDAKDKSIIGYKTPNYRFSIQNTISYKNFTLSFLINSIQGGDNYYLQNNAKGINVGSNYGEVDRMNQLAVQPYWTPDNGVTNATGIYNSQPTPTTSLYEDRSFVRLQDLSLSYAFGPALLKTLKLSNCQFFVSGKNLYTWTKWSGWDPETGLTSADAPVMRNITTGFKITL
jgi:TonB-linked SusC/RagA family outer membrane protein